MRTVKNLVGPEQRVPVGFLVSRRWWVVWWGTDGAGLVDLELLERC
jgi:hypothetical protein